MTEQHFRSLLAIISQDTTGKLTKQIPLDERLDMLAMISSKFRQSMELDHRLSLSRKLKGRKPPSGWQQDAGSPMLDEDE